MQARRPTYFELRLDKDWLLSERTRKADGTTVIGQKGNLEAMALVRLVPWDIDLDGKGARCGVRPSDGPPTAENVQFSIDRLCAVTEQ